MEAVSDRRLDAAEEEEGILLNVGCALFGGGEAMMEDEDSDALIEVGVTGTGRGAARLVGLAKDLNTALALGLPVADVDAASEGSCLSFESECSPSSSDFLRFGGLGLVGSSASSCDLREAVFEPFLDAMVRALALGGPQ